MLEGDWSYGSAFNQSESRLKYASSQGRIKFCSIVQLSSAGQSHSNMSSPINASALLDNTAVREILLDYENFDAGSSHDTTNTPAPTIVEMAPINPTRSRPLLRFNRLQSLRSQAKRIRQGPPRTPLHSIASFIEKCRQGEFPTGLVSCALQREFASSKRSRSSHRIKKKSWAYPA